MDVNDNGTNAAVDPADPAGTQEFEDDQHDVLAASFAQERLWFLDRLSAGSDEYTLSTVWRVTGPLDQDAWQGALDDLADRHEVLRTALVEADGRPVQRIAPAVSVPVERHDLSGLAAGQRLPVAREAAGRYRSEPFDLSRAPLIRCAVWTLDADDFLVVVVIHHAVTDGWSMRILVDELTALYEARVSGITATLPELRVQYADYAAWQRDWLAGETLHRQLDYWRNALAGITTLELPTDRPRPPVRTGKGGAVELTVPPELIESLEILGRENGATLFMVLLAAFQLVLGRWSGQDDLTVGTPIAGRNQKELEGLIGLFVNTLVVRADLAGDPTFTQHLARVRERVLGAFDHQDLPFERLVEDLQPRRDLSHNPLFQAWFVLQNFVPAREYEGSVSLAAVNLDAEAVSAPFDISLLARPVESGMRFEFTYAADLFDESTASRLAGHLRHVLEEIVAAPGTPVRVLELLTPPERAELDRFGGAANAPARAVPVTESFAARAAETPDAVAVVCEDRSLTYRQLDARSRTVAAALRAAGVRNGTRVGVCLGRGEGYVAALFGVWRAGGAVVPLDPAYPAERLAFMARDAGLVAVVCDRQRRELAATLAPLTVNADELPDGDGPLDGDVAPGDLAYVVYTSGSTGRPKGVAVGHDALARHVAAARELFGVTAADRVLQFSSFSFDASFDQLLPALTTGAGVVIRPDQPWLPERLPAIVERHAITVVNLPPAYWAEVVSALPATAATTLASLRLLILGGETLPTGPLAVWRDAVPHVEVVNAYGPTESTVTATAFVVRGVVVGRVPIGRPLGGRVVRIVDAVGGVVPVGVAGELCVAGPELAWGYLGRGGLTAECFVPDPWGVVGGRLYRTGDRARWLAGGDIEFLGRVDQQVKVRGFRIELGEVEATLARLPGVSAAATAIHGDQLVAYLVTTDPLTHSAVRQWCARTLPEHMVPGVTVTLAELPLLPGGKLDRTALPAPDGGTARSETAYVAPRDRIEQDIADIWAEVLGVERVGIDDGFFDLGGHSLLATMAISRIVKKLGRDVELRALFEKPRIRDFAPEVAAAGGTGDGGIVPVDRDGALAASFAQERLWFLDRLAEGGGAEYALVNVWRVRGALRAADWQGALNDVVARHEVLRTALVEVDGRPVQRIAGRVEVPVDRYDLSGVPAADRLEHARRDAARYCARPFDLARAPLVRCGVWTLDEDDAVVAVAFHHVVSDGWSADIFTRELTAFYEARVNAADAGLPELRVQYADFAAWQRARLTGDTLRRQLDHWRAALDGVTTLDLPTDRPRPAARTGRGATVETALPPGLADDLEALGRRHGATLFMVLLAAFHLVLARWSGQDDIAVGTPIAGRNRTEIEGLIGFFVNTLVVRADLTGDPTVAEHLARVRENVLGAFDHQDLPFERLVEELQPRRDLGRHPLFQVLFDVNDRKPLDFTASGARFGTFEIPWESAKFDLSLAFTTYGGDFSLQIEYATDLFDESSMRRLAGHVGTVLRSMCATPDARVHGLELLTADERAELAGFGAAGETSPIAGPVLDAFTARAVETPGAVAVVCEDRSLTYGELDQRVRRLAGALRARGVRARSRVGVCVGRGESYVVALLGVWAAGGAVVPLDPGYPSARLAFMVRDAGATVVVCDGAHRELAATLSREPLCLGDLPDGEESACVPVAPDDLAYVIYTSGSTGEPKGVAVGHDALARHVREAGRLFGITAADRVLQFASYSFDASLEQLLPALTTGATVVMRPDEIWTVDELTERVRDERITVMELVPAYWAELAASLTDKSAEALRSLRLLITGGDVLPAAPTADWFARLPGVPVVNTYGPTETTISATAFVVRGVVVGRVPIGRPLGGRVVRIVDAVGGVVPVGVAGELCVAGPELAWGYLGRGGLTAECFVPDPWGVVGGRLYRTGDRARWLAGGDIEFLGRVDQQVKVRGFRIELGEVEATLARLPGVSAAATAIHGDQLVAYLVTTAEVGHPAVRQWCARTLPEHMVPGVTVTLAELPLLPGGKLDRTALPAPRAGEADVEFVAPETPTEDVIAGIWAEVLGLDEVGVRHDFFALGGHSLRATMVASRLRVAFGCPVRVRDIFAHPTVAELAEAVEQLLIEEIAAMSAEEIDVSLDPDA